MARVRAPAANGEVLALPHFDEIPALVEENRRKLDREDVRIGGLPLRELRALARREVFELVGYTDSPAAPLLLTGHQPELSHPGVWVKNFALNGLARKLGGIPLNLIVDNDTLKRPSLHLPTFVDRDPASTRHESVAYDAFAGEVPYECRSVLDPELFRTFSQRITELTSNWGYEPLLSRVWRDGVKIGETFTQIRQDTELSWGCRNRELPVSWLASTHAFELFFSAISFRLPQFLSCYNRTVDAYRTRYGIQNHRHPVPNLSSDGTRFEAPFWQWSSGSKREPLMVWYDEFAPGYETIERNQKPYACIRPRTLTLTLFARLCLGDFFIHGIGGGKYDEVTDGIIRNYFGIEPPAYQILSATLHLPLPGFPSTEDDVKRAARRVRDLQWNPQAFVSPESARELLERHASLATNEPPYQDHATRKTWFREFQGVKERLRLLVADRVPAAEADLERTRAEAHANAILKRRDYSWVLYPEETLRPFLQRFLEV